MTGPDGETVLEGDVASFSASIDDEISSGLRASGMDPDSLVLERRIEREVAFEWLPVDRCDAQELADLFDLPVELMPTERPNR